MLSTRRETAELLSDVEQFAQRQLRYRSEISAFIDIATTHQQQKIFEDIIFLAKFLWNAYNLMQRIGPMGEGYSKLSGEFRDSLEKFSTLIKTLIKEGPEELKEKFKAMFFSMSSEHLNNLIQLSCDLSWLKNYSIDTKHSLF